MNISIVKDNWDILQSIGPLIGFIGLIGAAFVVYYLNRKQNNWELEHECKALAASILGELTAIYRLIHFRQYPDGIKDIIKELELGNIPVIPDISVRQNYFSVFEGNVGRLGILPNPLPLNIPVLYALMKALMEDCETLEERGLENASPDQMLHFFYEMNELMDAILKLIENIMTDLSIATKVSPPKFLEELLKSNPTVQ